MRGRDRICNNYSLRATRDIKIGHLINRRRVACMIHDDTAMGPSQGLMASFKKCGNSVERNRPAEQIALDLVTLHRSENA